MSGSDQQRAAGPNREDLPLPDYDQLPLGSLEHRVRTLDAAGVTTLCDYEQAHGRRQPVVTVLEQRLAALREGAEPSGGSPTGEQPRAPLPRPARARLHPRPPVLLSTLPPKGIPPIRRSRSADRVSAV